MALSNLNIDNSIDFIVPIKLRWQEKNNYVSVIPENKDTFYMTVEKAIQACQAHKNSAVFSNQFNSLLQKLGQWLKIHKDGILYAYVTIRDAGLLFLIVSKSNRYDGFLEDELTDLDVEIAQDKNNFIIF